jgi:hypothetical protein
VITQVIVETSKPLPTAGTRTTTATAATDPRTGTAEAGQRPLENRVDCFGEIFRSAARGLYMGNRGGRIHDPEKRRLDGRRWTSKSWICCETAFKERAREVWGQGYTELFFLDEVTALAAGHRPCFECRRAAAQAFAAAFARGNGLAEPPSAPHMDKVLHAERLDPESPLGREKKLYVAFVDSLPDGAVIASDGDPRQAFAIRGDFALPWSPEGYGRPMPRPRRRLVTLVTPPSTVMALNAGYAPAWHPSASIDVFERTYSDEAAA